MSKNTETSDEVEAREAGDSRERTSAIDLADDPRFQVGEVLLGKYRIERVLGQGGMGMVLGARHVELGELFAIKLMRGDAIQHPSIVERFMREARAMARLRSAHVARIYDVGRLGSGEPYMLMEHLAGFDLERWLDDRGALELDALAGYIVDACDAIAEAHAAGIVHRDLKPSNLFIDEQRGKRVIKVLDFGISKERDTGRARLTSTHSLLGSPLYMSPEQALEPKVVDARSDIWSLGVSLYELATGVAPFDADGVPEVVARILQHEPPPPSTIANALPAWFDAVVMRCLAKPMHERFQRVEDLAAAIIARDSDIDIEEQPTRIVTRDSSGIMDTEVVTARGDSPVKRAISRTPSGTERIDLPPAATATGFGTFSPKPPIEDRSRARSRRTWAAAGVVMGVSLMALASIALRSPRSPLLPEPSALVVGTLPAKGTPEDEAIAPTPEPLVRVESPTASASASSGASKPITRHRTSPSALPSTAPSIPSARNVLNDL